jgi:superfamily II DNA helicase RecQ
MALLTQFASFFISPFGEKSVTDELNAFLRSQRIVNVEKRLIDGERGTGWVFLVEYGNDNGKSSLNAVSKVDYREKYKDKPADYTLYNKLRDLRKTVADKAGIPLYAIFTNDQLSLMVDIKPKTTRDLLSITGIGEARIKQYGQEFVNIFTVQQSAPDDSNEKKEQSF